MLEQRSSQGVGGLCTFSSHEGVGGFDIVYVLYVFVLTFHIVIHFSETDGFHTHFTPFDIHTNKKRNICIRTCPKTMSIHANLGSGPPSIEYCPPLFMLASECDAAPRDRPCGAQRRRRRNALPRPVWFFSKDRRCIVGAAIITKALRDGKGQHKLQLERFVSLRIHKPVSRDMCKFQASVFVFTAAAEISMRSSEASVSGSMMDHFSDFLFAAAWKVVTVPCHSDVAAMCVDPGQPFYMNVPEEVVRVLGVASDVEEFASSSLGVVVNEDSADDNDFPALLDDGASAAISPCASRIITLV